MIEGPELTASGTAKIGEMTTKNTHQKVFELIVEDSSLKKVMDIPCGHGAFSKRLLAHNLEVYAADCVDRLELKDERLHFTKGDMNLPLPLDNASLDAVTCLDGIEHIERPFDFVRECHRILRPGGRLLISTPNISSLRSRWRWLLTGFHNKCKTPLDETAPNPLHHIAMVSFPELRYMLHTSGFVVNAVRTNRVKSISWIYAWLIPFAYLATRQVFRKEAQSSAEIKINREVLKTMFSVPLLFGETLIVDAKRR